MTDTTTAGGAAAAVPAAAAASAVAAAAKPWYDGKLDTDVIGYLQNKGLDPNDPAKLALGLIPQYRNVEKLVGVKPEDLVRWPKDVGDTDNWNNVHTRLGVPKEAKDYDLSTVKRADGTEIDSVLADTIRASLLKAKTAKEAGPEIAKDFVKYIDDKAKSDLAEVTATVQAQQKALNDNWGTNREANMFIAKAALEKLGQASGLTPEQIKSGWDAITTTGGIGASYAMQMLLTAGKRMGEDRYVAGGQGGSPELMSRESAAAEIETLKRDTQFGERLKKGDTEASKKWRSLHAVAFGQAA